MAVLTGSTPDTAIFPSDAFTVADAAQVTGRRVNLPLPACTQADYSWCDAITLVNQLDGFDVRPRVTIPFSGPIDLATVTPASVYIEGPGGFRTGLTQLVFDPATNVLAGQPVSYLNQDTTYRTVVTASLHDLGGHPVATCGGDRCTAHFTTESTTTQLARLRAALDDGSAYSAAGIDAAERGASFIQDGRRDVFPAASVTEIERQDQVRADPQAPLRSSMVLNTATAAAAYYGFGSFLVPRYQDAGAFIGQVPTRSTPQPRSQQRVGFHLIVPAGVAPAGGWPVAIFGPGFTRSKYDLFLAADLNAARGVATIATDPAGHGFGPASRTVVHQGPLSTSFLSHGQGVDLDGDGTIDPSEGVSPTDHKTYDGSGNLVTDTPSHQAVDGLRDGLIQSTVNQMALVRMVERGVDVLGDGTVKLRPSGVAYYGQSFGGIYGTMLMATDTHLQVGVLNVPGGPIVEIARNSGFRDLLAHQLEVNRPNLLNGGPGLNGFTESMPLRQDPSVAQPHPGAIPIQRYLAYSNWFERPGSLESFSAGVGSKRVIFQSAYGDHTVPNSTAGELYRAGDLFSRVSYYRNDKSASAGFDPHGFLLDPRLAGRNQAQLQVITFVASGGATVIDPDGPGPVWEVPIQLRSNLDCLHYPEPQTGGPYTPGPGTGDC